VAKQIVKHINAAGSNFNGSLPSGTPDVAGERRTYPAQAGGGKFEFASDVLLEKISLKLDGDALHTVDIVDENDVLVKRIAETELVGAEPARLIRGGDPDKGTEDEYSEPVAGQVVPVQRLELGCKINLTAGQKLVVTTTNSTGETSVEVIAEDGL
jgi:hypothetical protein